MESCYPGIHDLYCNELKENGEAIQNKENGSKTSLLFRINESKNGRFLPNRENLKENQEEITNLLTIFFKNFYSRMQSKNRANYSELSDPMA
ncbi:unnamed protein product [marine sediment metagenome]|uniref:Uncharacterized protein n=1 Tax=marine sediment metagenome TaxID=412755 RepID=X1L0R1_9ZZZZ